jgi:hypothetical protein
MLLILLPVAAAERVGDIDRREVVGELVARELLRQLDAPVGGKLGDVEFELVALLRRRSLLLQVLGIGGVARPPPSARPRMATK